MGLFNWILRGKKSRTITQNPLNQNIIQHFGLEGLGPKKQEETILRIGKLIYQKVMIRAMELLDDKAQDEFDKFLNALPKNENAQDKIMEFLKIKIPNLDEITKEEVAKLKKETVSNNDTITKKIIAQKKNLSKELGITLDDNQIARISKSIYNNVFLHRTKRKYHYKEYAEEFQEILKKNIGSNEDIIVRWLKPKTPNYEKVVCEELSKFIEESGAIMSSLT